MFRRLTAAAGLLLVTACATAGGGGAMSVKDQMAKIVDPASMTLFSIGGKVDPANGPDARATDAEWKSAADAALSMKRVAAYMIAHPVDQGTWMTTARQLSDLSDKAAKAAGAKDGKTLAQAANDLGDNCFACHGKYKNQHPAG